MDRETFLLAREQIQSRMEAERQDVGATRASFPVNGVIMGMLPIGFSIVKNIFFNQKKTLLQIIFAALGVRVLRFLKN